ncbi:unnamed protein product [Cunninghamella blakesleeana]
MVYCFSTVIKRPTIKISPSAILCNRIYNIKILTIRPIDKRQLTISSYSKLNPKATNPLTKRPSMEYLDISKQPSTLLTDIQKQLLILDLNGTLLSRTRKRTGMFVRPNINNFLNYIFKNFQVMVWSSAQKNSVNRMLQLFEQDINRLSLIWDRSDMGLTIEQFHSKSTTVKDLQKIWDTFDNNEFNATNTILIDDSPSKSVLQPYNCISISTFNHTSSQFLLYGDNELLNVIDYLNKLKYQSNVSNFIQSTPYTPLICEGGSKLCKYYSIDKITINSSHDHDFTSQIDRSNNRTSSEDGRKKRVRRRKNKKPLADSHQISETPVKENQDKEKEV